MWQKFMLITPWSGLGAVSRAPIGVLLEQDETRELLTEAIDEIYQLGRALKIGLPEGNRFPLRKTQFRCHLDFFKLSKIVAAT